MGTEDLIKSNFRRLLDEAERILADCGWDGRNYYRHPADNDYTRFRTEGMNVVRRSCGEESDHYRELTRLAQAKESSNNSFYFVHCVGVVEAGNGTSTVASYSIFDIWLAEVLGDFIEQAEALLRAGYFVPAASLTGAVLEDTRRKISEKNSIAVPTSMKIDSLNSELARAGVYDKLVQKRITAFADIRNNADHGHFSKFKQGDVEAMLKWVRSFATDSLK